MAEFKKQHFVPQAYLRRFACDSSGKKILALVNSQWKTASIKGQCQKDYFFSRKEPKETESRIACGEILLQKIDNKATVHQYSSALIWLLIELHFKSSRYVFDNNFERVEKLNKIFGSYLQESLLKQIGYTVETNDPAEVLYALQCSWTTKRYFFKEDTLITSDSPVVLIVVDNRLSVIVWPSSSSSVVIAYDFSYISDIRPAKKDEFFADSLNNLIALGCYKNIYSSKKKPEAQTRLLAQYMSENLGKQEVWDSGDKSMRIPTSSLSMGKQNGVFNYDMNLNPERIIPYSKAKELLKSKKVVFDSANRKIYASMIMTYYELFCVNQLANLPWKEAQA